MKIKSNFYEEFQNFILKLNDLFVESESEDYSSQFSDFFVLNIY